MNFLQIFVIAVAIGITSLDEHAVTGRIKMSEIINSDLCRNETEEKIYNVCMDLAVFLIEKNRRYGNSAIKPIRVLSKANEQEQIFIRMDDKLSRLMSMDASIDDKYEALKDFVGYWVLLEVQRGERGKDE